MTIQTLTRRTILLSLLAAAAVSCQTTKRRGLAAQAPKDKRTATPSTRTMAPSSVYFMTAHTPKALTARPKNLSWLQGNASSLQAQLKKNPHDTNAQLALAQIYLGDGNLTSAQKLAQSVLAVNFTNRDAKIVLAHVAYLEQRYPAAKALLEQIGGASAAESEALNLGGCLAWHDGDNAKAELLWLGAVKKNPGDLAARMNSGLALLKRDQYGPAQEQFRAVLSRWPDNPDAKIQLGVALALQGKTSDALQLYQESRKLYPQSQLLLFNLAAIQTRAKDYKGAVDTLHQFLNLKTLNYASHDAALALLEEIRRDKGTDSKLSNAELDRMVADEANNKTLSAPEDAPKPDRPVMSTAGFYY